MITALITILCFILSIPIGGWLAHRQVYQNWTLDQEIRWWINIIFKRR